MSIFQGSRYAKAPGFKDNVGPNASGIEFLGTPDPLDLPVAADDLTVPTNEADTGRPDRIAYRAYGRNFGAPATRLYHVILAANGILNPFAPLPQTLRAPHPDRLLLDVLGE